jgi:hypothetical protein
MSYFVRSYGGGSVIFLRFSGTCGTCARTDYLFGVGCYYTCTVVVVCIYIYNIYICVCRSLAVVVCVCKDRGLSYFIYIYIYLVWYKMYVGERYYSSFGSFLYWRLVGRGSNVSVLEELGGGTSTRVLFLL